MQLSEGVSNLETPLIMQPFSIKIVHVVRFQPTVQALLPEEEARKIEKEEHKMRRKTKSRGGSGRVQQGGTLPVPRKVPQCRSPSAGAQEAWQVLANTPGLHRRWMLYEKMYIQEVECV